MIRLFAAIVPPAEPAAALASLQRGLLGARWRPPESLHLTLRFFGPVREDVADDIDSALAAIRSAAFRLALAGVGTFDDGPETRAVWAGVEPSEPLAVLAGRCERAARRAGLPAEKRAFRPHVTLAYLRRAASPDVAAWLQGRSLFRSDGFEVGRFGLYSSWPGPEGSLYRLERAYPLS